MRIVTSSVQVLTRYHLKLHNPVVIKNCQAMHSRHYLHSTRWLDKINAYEHTISQSGNTSEGYNFLSPPASAIKTESTFSEWTRNDYKQHKLSAANVNNSFTAVGDLTRWLIQPAFCLNIATLRNLFDRLPACGLRLDEWTKRNIFPSRI